MIFIVVCIPLYILKAFIQLLMLYSDQHEGLTATCAAAFGLPNKQKLEKFPVSNFVLYIKVYNHDVNTATIHYSLLMSIHLVIANFCLKFQIHSGPPILSGHQLSKHSIIQPVEVTVLLEYFA